MQGRHAAAAIMTLQIYGAQIRNSVTASPNTSGRSSKPGAIARMMIPAPAMHAKAKNPVHKASLARYRQRKPAAGTAPQPFPRAGGGQGEGQRTFAEQPPCHVRNPQCRRERVRRPRTAEQPCNAGIAHKP